MKKKILYAFLIAILLSILPITPSSAHHYLYWAEEWADQNPFHQYNFVNFWWWQGSATKWWVDPAAGSQFASDVQAAIDNWESEFLEDSTQRLPWEKTTIEADAHVKFRFATTPCGYIGATGCTNLVGVVYRTPPNGNENAYYAAKWDVFIKDPAPWAAPLVRRSVIAHEVGHVYGLNDQYVDSGTEDCNWDVNSVMDADIIIFGDIWSCDFEEGPTTLDIARVKAFWGGWEAGTPEGLKRAEPILTAVGVNSWIIATWADFAWSDTFHLLDWYWSSNENGPWTSYKVEIVTTDTGVHYHTGARAIRRDVNRTDYTEVPAGWHRVCGWTWSGPFGQWSNNNRCSNPVQLN